MKIFQKFRIFRKSRISKKFRKSIISIFVGLSLLLSTIEPTNATSEVDAFTSRPSTSRNRPHQSHAQKSKGRGVFGNKANPGSSGAGKPGGGDGGDDIPNCPTVESVEEAQERIERMKQRRKEMEELPDSDSSDSETNQEPLFGSRTYQQKKIIRDLDRQKKKAKIHMEVGEQKYTIDNVKRDPLDTLSDKLAAQIYDSIRESNTDISDIAQNLGFKPENIDKVKQHVFLISIILTGIRIREKKLSIRDSIPILNKH